MTDGAVRQLLNRARNSLRAAAAAIMPDAAGDARGVSADSADPVAARWPSWSGSAAARWR